MFSVNTIISDKNTLSDKKLGALVSEKISNNNVATNLIKLFNLKSYDIFIDGVKKKFRNFGEIFRLRKYVDRQRRHYLNYAEENIKNEITGSIFKSTVDASHPLAFGYSSDYYSLKLSSDAFELLEKGSNVSYFPENSSNISGYTGPNALKQVPNSLLFGIERIGRGNIIYMVDNPLFRSFWENGKLFFVNAIFLN